MEGQPWVWDSYICSVPWQGLMGALALQTRHPWPKRACQASNRIWADLMTPSFMHLDAAHRFYDCPFPHHVLVPLPGHVGKISQLPALQARPLTAVNLRWCLDYSSKRRVHECCHCALAVPPPVHRNRMFAKCGMIRCQWQSSRKGVVVAPIRHGIGSHKCSLGRAHQVAFVWSL